MQHSSAQQVGYVFFMGSLLYCGSVLPCGRFYYEGVEGFFGNTALKLSYQYIYFYLAVALHMLDAVERAAQTLPLLSYLLGLGGDAIEELNPFN